MITFIILLVITGLIVGALGRLALPGPDPMTLGQTILVGIAATVVAGLIGRLLFGGGGGWLLSVVCSLGIVYLIRRSRERRFGAAARS
ncbi:MAG: GlsB/YeaQ/YmgE family stress response membrane protein [Thermoleophilaceae bacterium]